MSTVVGANGGFAVALGAPKIAAGRTRPTRIWWMNGAPACQVRIGHPMFNGVDYLILITFMAIVGFGFFGGIARVSAAIVAIYFSAILAAAFYQPVTDLSQSLFKDMSQRIGELIMFVLLLLVFSAVFTLIVSRWLSRVQLPREVLLMDNIGGVVLGLALSAMTVTFAALFLTIVLQALNQTVTFAGSDSVLGFARGQIRESALLPMFLRMAPFVSGAISPWFPDGIPPILDGAP